MAIIEGTGIVAAGKEARAKALAKSKQVTSDKKIAAEYRVDPIDRMIKDIESNFQRLREEGSTGAEKNTGRGMGDIFDPAKDFRVKKPGFFSPGGGAFDERNNVEVATTDLSGLVSDSDEKSESTFGTSFTEQASANLADASIYQKKEDGIYRPSDNIYDSLKEITRPKIEEKKPYLDSRGDYFDKKPFTETDGGSFYGSTDAKIIQRKGDDMRFSQPYSRDDKGELTRNYQKEYSSYLQSGESPFAVGLSKTLADQVATGKTPRTTGEKLGAFFFNKDKYMPKSMENTTRMLTKPEFEQYRRDLVKTAAEKSIYGADVEVGKKRFVEGTGFDEYKRNDDFTYTKTGEKINQLQDTNIPKGEGYFFKDFYKPGEFKTKEDLNRYLTDRGAYMTNMPSNFEGGISGKGEKTDDFSQDSRYQSTAGNLAKEQSEPSTLQKVGNFLGRVTRPPGAEASENPLSRTAPVGGFNISQEGKDQAAINKGIKAAEATGIPSGVAAQGGVTTQAARDAGVKARQEAADKRAKNMSEAQGIAARNPNVSIVGGRAVAANDSGKARAQAAAVNRKIQGKTVSQVKAENKKKMQDAAKKRNEAFKKSKAQKKKSGGGFGKPTSTKKKSAPKKSAPKKSAPKKKAAPSTNKRAQAAAKRRASQAKAKKSKSKSSKSKSSKSKSSKSSGPGSSRGKAAAKGRTRRGRRGRRCDIFLKYNISPLTNMNLIRDDLAEVAYFVKEIQK